ncbi:hypothetical protein ACNFR6_33035, partial [Streptomyces sp. ECR3]
CALPICAPDGPGPSEAPSGEPEGRRTSATDPAARPERPGDSSEREATDPAGEPSQSVSKREAQARRSEEARRSRTGDVEPSTAVRGGPTPG